LGQTHLPKPDPKGTFAFNAATIQQTAGNLALQRLLDDGVLQAKLTVSQPTDPYEQEADRIAEQVVSSAPTNVVQRSCSSCTTGVKCSSCENEQYVQAKALPGHVPQLSPHSASQIGALSGRGEALPVSVRSLFEPRFGRDFSQVRFHRDGQAAESALALQASAFTSGHDIVFGPNQYAPETAIGKRLIAHELAHVVQQGRAGSDLTKTIQRQQAAPDAAPGAGRCRAVAIELPNRIYFTGDRGAVSATVSTTIPRGDFRITYAPATGRFVVGAIGFDPREDPTLIISAPSDQALFETYRESVTREGVTLHVTGVMSGDQAASLPLVSITPDYARSLDDTRLTAEADVYRTRLLYSPEGPESLGARENLRVLQTEQLRRQAANVQIAGEVGRPLGLPTDGSFVLQPANNLDPSIVANLPDGQILALPVGPEPGTGGGGGGEQERPEIIVIRPLGEDMQPLGPGRAVGSDGPRPTDITNPLAGAGLATNLSINAGLVRTGFGAAGPDAIGIIGVPRWFTPGAMVPETVSKWGHTAVYVRRAGQIEIVRGFGPQMGGSQLLPFLRNASAVESGTGAVPASIGADAGLFTLTGARSVEYPVTAALAEEFARGLPLPGPVTAGGRVPPLYTARPAVYQACTGSNCVLWAVNEAEQALGGVIGPAQPGVSVTALAEGGNVVEATASQGRLILFTRQVARGEQAVAPALATGAPVAAGMSRGLQVLKWGGRAFFVIGLLTIPLEIFLAPPGQGARTAVGATAGFLGGLAAGAAAGLVCGPGAPVCSVVLGLVFGIAGALGARSLAESMFDYFAGLKEGAIELYHHPGAILAPPMATTLVFRGGYRGLLRSPLDVANEMRQQRESEGPR
jgi:hypothetical protein